MQEQLIAGFDFEYRVVGDASEDGTRPQLWLYGETVHGVRSGDTDCEAQPDTDVCTTLARDPPASGQQRNASLAIFRKATSFEGFTGLRLELLSLRRESTDAASTLYVKGQLGFLTVGGQGGDVRDIHHAGLGLMLTNGPLVGSYFEIGRGVNDVFLDGRKRFKLDALLLFDTRRAVTPFAQLVVDTDMGNGPDSIQSYFGFDIDVRRLFRVTNVLMDAVLLPQPHEHRPTSPDLERHDAGITGEVVHIPGHDVPSGKTTASTVTHPPSDPTRARRRRLSCPRPRSAGRPRSGTPH